MLLKHMLRQFHFTRAERSGAAALLILVLFSFIFPGFYAFFYRPGHIDFSAVCRQIQGQTAQSEMASSAPAVEIRLFAFDPNTASAAIFMQLGLSEKVARTIVKYREHGGRFRTADDLQKIYTLPEADFERLRPYVRVAGERSAETAFEARSPGAKPALFAFDPNTADTETLLRLGLSRALVARLLHYREKGGFFFEKTDFKKLYGLAEVDYTRLEPYIQILKSAVAVRPAAYAGGAVHAPAIVELDINSANAEEWQRLPGIGAARAQKIVQFRDKLGGFVQIGQVRETYGLPDSVFQRIQPMLRLRAPAFRKIDLNTASVQELAAHPYFDFKQAQLIVRYREQHGAYPRAEAIAQIAAFSDQGWLERVKGYLYVQPK